MDKYFVGRGSKILEALDALGVVPARCQAVNIKLRYDDVVTITYECVAVEEEDQAIADALKG